MNEDKLAGGIIARAIEDYQRAFLGYELQIKSGKEREPAQVKASCEKFFKSGWFNVLSDLDGVGLMNKIQENEIEKLKAAYEKALEAVDFKFTVSLKGGNGKSEQHEVTIPPALVGAFKTVMRKQVMEFEKKLKELKKGSTDEPSKKPSKVYQKRRKGTR